MADENIKDKGILINEQNFPDANFRNWLLEQEYGKTGVIDCNDIPGITKINVDEMEISSLEGIQYFTALTMLNCYWNQLTALDVSKNTALTVLACDNNQLTSLDISKNTALTVLACDNNQLTSLDISKNTALTTLYCDNNQLTALDVSGCTALTELYCADNQLTSLDVSKNTALTKLSCYDNPLTSLDVSNNTALEELSCSSNQLTSLDVSKNTALTELRCYDNQLTALNVSGCTALTGLYCFNNRLTALDASGCMTLTRLYCYKNQISGENMDFLINSLPNRIESDYSTLGFIYIYDSTSETEGNVCTKSQVAAIKEKGWLPRYYDGIFWEIYEGCDDADGIIATEVGNGSEIDANAPAYDLNGKRVEDWQNTPGIYIINGKKVMVK